MKPCEYFHMQWITQTERTLIMLVVANVCHIYATITITDVIMAPTWRHNFGSECYSWLQHNKEADSVFALTPSAC